MTRYEIDPDNSQVWIEGSSSVHPIHATATGLRGFLTLGWKGATLRADTAVTGRVEIDVDRLRSGNDLVDRETRRRIDARRHPLIVGEITAVEHVGRDSVALRGTIAFRGETRDVTGEVRAERADDGSLRVEGEQTFDVRDWGLQPPRLLMLRVHPDVRVRIALSLRA